MNMRDKDESIRQTLKQNEKQEEQSETKKNDRRIETNFRNQNHRRRGGGGDREYIHANDNLN